MRIRLALGFLLAIVAAGCATSGGSSREPRRNTNLLTLEEMAPMEAYTAWEVVQRLRPRWMRPGGVRNSANPRGQYPAVFVDGSFYGDMESLRSFKVVNLQEMRYVSGTDATIRYGGEFQGGIILLTSRRE